MRGLQRATARFLLSAPICWAVLGGCGPDVRAGGDSACDVVEIRFEFVRNQILLPVRLGAQGPFHMLLDTAGDPSAIDLATALETGQAVDTSVVGEASGVGSERVPIYPATLAALELGDLAIDELEALAIDLSPFGDRLGRPLHGILGYSFFEDRVVQIDYPAGLMRVCRGPGSLLEEANTAGRGTVVRLPLRFDSDSTTPLIEELYVNGRRVPVSLDTGSSLGLELFDVAIAELGLEGEREAARVDSVFGARGGAERRVGRVDSMRIGQLDLDPDEVSFSGRESTSLRQGNLGNRLLRDLVLTFDYRRRSLTIERSKD